MMLKCKKKKILMTIEIAKRKMYFLRTINIVFLIIKKRSKISKISKKSKIVSNQQSVKAISILIFFQKKTPF